VGNAFINAGGEYLVRQVFPDAEYFAFEFFDSAIPLNYKYPSETLLKNDIRFINENCDVAFIFSGCIISKYTKNILDELARLKCKKVLLGAGSYQYDDFDKKLSLAVAKKYDYIFTRDNLSYNFFDGAENVFSAIDLAFFVKDSINNTNLRGKYAVVNIDPIEVNYTKIKQERRKLKLRLAYDKIYIVENTTVKHDMKSYLYIGYWDNLFKLYSNAKYVITNRIHTAVCCTCYTTPFKYIGTDEGGNIGRNTLFPAIDDNFILENGRMYKASELNTYLPVIEQKKAAYINKLRKVLNKYTREKL
jgi:hypothetical protein